MRNAFAKQLLIEAEKNDKIIFLSGDIGNRLFDNFKLKYPNRFINCGVAEANMTGVASGLSKMGFIPITYTITTFNTYRVYEQIKLDIAYPNLPAIIVGTGAGLSYSNLGVTHHSLEDISIMRSLPNMNVICPGDPVEVGLALKEAIKLKKPTYLRIGKKGEVSVHKHIPKFTIGKALQIYNGSEVVILSVGNVLSLCAEISLELKKLNINPSLVSLHTVKPLDKIYLKKAFKEYKLVVLVEEHSEIGGASSALLEFLNKNNLHHKKYISFSTPDKYLSSLGSQTETRRAIGLENNKILKKIIKALNEKN
jgi:transketolase